MSSSLVVKLVASPTTLTMKDRSKFSIGIEAVNNGSTAVDPKLGAGNCTLKVNGKPSMQWNLAIGNGARDPSWTSLPPGKKISIAWPLGESLFPSAGDYHLEMTAGDQQDAVDVKVSK